MTFEEWLNETENFSTREDRLRDDFGCGLPYGTDTSCLLQWLKAAYWEGYAQGNLEWKERLKELL